MMLSLLPTMAWATEGGATPVAKIGEQEYDTLADAVAAAESGNTVEIIKAGEYSVPTPLTSITVKGAVDGVIFNAVGTGNIAAAVNVTFQNITFNMGNGSYHGFQHNGGIRFEECVFNGLFNSYGTGYYYKCTFNQTATQYCMWVYGGDTITYDTCTFNTCGKVLNVYNENNGHHNLVVKDCTFKNENNSVCKPAVLIKSKCGAAELEYDVAISGSNTLVGNWPSESSVYNDGNMKTNGLWDVEGDGSKIAVTVDNSKVYPASENPEPVKNDLVKLQVTVNEEKGITEEVKNAVSNNTAVSEFTDTKLSEAYTGEGSGNFTVQFTLNDAKPAEDNVAKLTYNVVPTLNDAAISNDKLSGAPITFRLPLIAAFNDVKVVKVIHHASSGNKETFYAVQGETNAKYVEITTTSFSDFDVLGTALNDVPVAQIGTQGYETLQAAIDAAQTGDTIELLANVEEGVSITGKAVYIDSGDFEYGDVDAECYTITKNKGILFGDLERAVAVAKNGGITPYYQTILFFVLKDIKLDSNIELPFYGNTNSALWYYGGISPENAVLDLNGHTISQGYGNDGGYWYGSVRVEYTNLTIKDSSTAQTGKITGYGSCVVVNAETEYPATVTLESGTLSMTGDIPHGGNGIVQTQQAGQFIMTGGTIDGSAVADGKLARGLFELTFLNNGKGKGQVTINDGYFKAVAEGKRDTTKDELYISPDGFLFNYYKDGTQPTVTGGYYDFDPSAYVADGFKVVELTSGTEFVAGYCYKVVPEARTVNVDSTDTLQQALDNAQDGDTIVLAAGSYDTVYLRQNLAKSTARDDLDRDASYPAYYREIKNVTIKAADDATVTMNGNIVAESGLFWYSSAPASNQAAMNKENGGFVSYLLLENLTINGLTFDQSGIVLRDNAAVDTRSNICVDGLTIQNCTGTGTATNKDLHFFSAGAGTNDQNFPDTEKKAFNNITIRNNTLDSYYQPICTNNATAVLNGLTVTGNSFTDCMDNQLQLANKVNTGAFVISGNTFTNMTGRVLRLTNAQETATFDLTNNIIVTPKKYDTGGDGTIAKITGVNGFTVTDTNSQWTAGAFNEGKTTWQAMGDTSLLAQPVAKINDTKYATLAAAIAAVPADGTETTITMIANEVIEGNTGVTVAAGQNIVLDLNGKTVKNAVNEDKASQVITNKGILTIKDGSTGGNGVLKNEMMESAQAGDWWSTPQYNWATNVIVNQGTLTVESGTIYQTAEKSICYAIDTSNYVNATLTINGGAVKSECTAIRLWPSSGKHDLTITNGEIYGKGRGIQLHSAGNSTVNISGGSITTKDNAGYAFLDLGAGENQTYNLSDGTFGGDIYSYGANFNITGGTYNGEVTVKNKTGFITGGTFNDNVKATWGYVYLDGDDVYSEDANYQKADKYNAPWDKKAYWEENGYSFELYSGEEYRVTYFAELDEDYIAEGYEKLDPSEVVTDKEHYVDVVPIYVAQIGSTKYASLAEAVAEVNSGETIKLLSDIAFGEFEGTALSIPTGKNFTLDLAGKTISGTATNAGTSQLIDIAKGATVTIEDSGENGKVTYNSTKPDPSWSYGTYTINNAGTLTLKNGRIENTTVNGASYAVENHCNWTAADATFNMKGGVVTCPKGDQAVRLYSNWGGSMTTVGKSIMNMTGGTIEAGGIWCNDQVAAASKGGYIELNISGGTINGMLDFIGAKDQTVVNISGGTFDCSKLRLRNSQACENTEPYLNITGGQWKIAEIDNQNTNSATTNTMNITGGVFNFNGEEGVKTTAANFIVEGKEFVPNTNAQTKDTYPWTIGTKQADVVIKDGDGDTKVTTKVTTTTDYSVDTTEVTLDDAQKTAIETRTEVKGVELKKTATVGTGDNKVTGVQAVFNAAKEQATTDSNTTFTDAVAAATTQDTVVTVKVDVEVKPTKFDTENEIKFELKPVATVTIRNGEGAPATQTVPVTNDMIDQEQDIEVSIYTGAKPAQIVHKDDAGNVIEIFGEGAFTYADGVATVTIHHFSSLTALMDPNAVVPPVAKNTDTGVEYTTLASALTAAQNGETVVLLDNISNELYVVIKDGVILNLNGHNITGAELINNNGTIKDTAGNGYVAAENYTFSHSESEYFAVYDKTVNGYQFINTVKILSKFAADNTNKFKFHLQKPSNTADAQKLRDLLMGAAESEKLKVYLVVTTPQETGENSQKFSFYSEYVQELAGAIDTRDLYAIFENLPANAKVHAQVASVIGDNNTISVVNGTKLPK